MAGHRGPFLARHAGVPRRSHGQAAPRRGRHQRGRRRFGRGNGRGPDQRGDRIDARGVPAPSTMVLRPHQAPRRQGRRGRHLDPLRPQLLPLAAGAEMRLPGRRLFRFRFLAGRRLRRGRVGQGGRRDDQGQAHQPQAHPGETTHRELLSQERTEPPAGTSARNVDGSAKRPARLGTIGHARGADLLGRPALPQAGPRVGQGNANGGAPDDPWLPIHSPRSARPDRSLAENPQTRHDGTDPKDRHHPAPVGALNLRGWVRAPRRGHRPGPPGSLSRPAIVVARKCDSTKAVASSSRRWSEHSPPRCDASPRGHSTIRRIGSTALMTSRTVNSSSRAPGSSRRGAWLGVDQAGPGQPLEHLGEISGGNPRLLGDLLRRQRPLAMTAQGHDRPEGILRRLRDQEKHPRIMDIFVLKSAIVLVSWISRPRCPLFALAPCWQAEWVAAGPGRVMVPA